MLDPVKITLSKDTESQLRTYMNLRIDAQVQGLRELFDTRVVRWRKAYDAVPQEQVREFPFHRASNLVVPLVAIHSDTLQSRIMAAVFKTNPLWVMKVLGDHKGEGDPMREALQEFMQYVGVEPRELDLYRVYHEATGELCRFGTVTLKSPWEHIWEDRVVPSGDGSGRVQFVRSTTYDGPRPEKLPFEDFLIDPASKTCEGADFRVHRRRLTKAMMFERRYLQVFDAAKVDAIMARPDRTSPSQNQQQVEETIGARTAAGYDFAEWDVFECWFKWRTPDGKLTPVIISYHRSSETILRAFYDFYPTDPFIGARLFYRDDQYFGYGFAETLAMFQEEISQIHNDRRDNMTVANTMVWRVNPDSKLHQGYKIYPSAMLPAEKDEIESLSHGDVATQALTIEEERLVLELAERRSGVSPPQQGYGAGIMHGRRGVYTAMGTMSLLQEGNNRTDLNTTDFRYAHSKLGRLLCLEYATFGVGQRVRLFGEDALKIVAGLEAIRSGRIGIPIYAATSSVNKEVEKQNAIMLIGVMTRHYQMVAQLLQAASTPQIPPNVRQYFSDVIVSADRMMKSTLKVFDHDEPEQYVPTAQTLPTGGQGAQQSPVQGAAEPNPSLPYIVGGSGVS